MMMSSRPTTGVNDDGDDRGMRDCECDDKSIQIWELLLLPSAGSGKISDAAGIGNSLWWRQMVEDLVCS